MTQHECVQLNHVLQMYHVGYHKGHRPSSIREPPVESATSITVQHPDRIEFPEGGASQCSVGSRRVVGKLRKDGGCPKGRDRLLVACRWGRPAHIDKHGTRVVGVLLDSDADPIRLPRGRGEDDGHCREGLVGERQLLLLLLSG